MRKLKSLTLERIPVKAPSKQEMLITADERKHPAHIINFALVKSETQKLICCFLNLHNNELLSACIIYPILLFLG